MKAAKKSSSSITLLGVLFKTLLTALFKDLVVGVFSMLEDFFLLALLLGETEFILGLKFIGKNTDRITLVIC